MKNISLLLASILLISLGSCAEQKQEPGLVKTTNGMVQGSAEGDLTVFKGIPFEIGRAHV